MNLEAIGDEIRSARGRRGWSQQDLAQEVDVSLTTVQNWEAHRSEGPRWGEFQRLCRVFGWRLQAPKDAASRVLLNGVPIDLVA